MTTSFTGTGTETTASRAVSAATLKQNLRVDFDDDDTLIESMLDAATNYLERATGVRLQGASEVTDTYPEFFDKLHLNYWPVQSVTSVTYTDDGGDSQTVDSGTYYLWDRRYARSCVVIHPDYAWPSDAILKENAVTVTYQAGFESLSDIPKSLIQAIILLASHWYINRETVTIGTLTKNVEFSLEALLSSHKLLG